MINVYVLDRYGTWTTRQGANEMAARAICREEAKWEGAVFVLCPKLDIEVLGDFVGLTHSFELKGTL